MAYLSRADLLAACVLPREVVKVPELNGEVIIQGMNGAQRDEWEASLWEGRGKRRKMNTANIRAKLVAQCCVDEDGRRLFTDEDTEALGTARVDVLNRLFSVAQRLSGVSDEDVDELGESIGFDERRAFYFSLALKLKMTVSQLLTSISSQELTEWGQFFEWREAEEAQRREFEAKVAAAERYVNEGK